MLHCLSSQSIMEISFYRSIWTLHLKTLHLEGHLQGEITTTHKEQGSLPHAATLKTNRSGQVIERRRGELGAIKCNYEFFFPCL